MGGNSSTPPQLPHQNLPVLAVDRVPAFWLPYCEGTLLRPAGGHPSGPQPPEPPLIYAVDDFEYLTELYTVVLETSGYIVRAFTDRVAALVALKSQRRKPGLLITDYAGGTLPIERFLQQCRALHPTLRVLMATGFNEADLHLAGTRADRFLRKPFTARVLCAEVRALLPGSQPASPG